LQVDELAESNAYSAIAHGADGSIWVGGSYGGNRFFAYDANSAWESLDDVLGFNSVSTFYGTADGMWIGHSDGAVFYEYATGSWTEVERADEAGQGIYDGGATAIAIDAKGNMWFGTYSGLTMWDGSSFTYFDLLDDAERADGRYPRNVYSLLAVGDSVWVATSGVIFRFDSGTEAARFNEGAGDMPFFFTAYSLAQDADGNVLAGVNDTLMQYNGSGWDEVQEFDRDVRSILLTPDGVLFIGLSGAGVVSNLQGDWETVTVADGLPSNSFSGQQSIAIDYLGSMWFAASEGGILRWVP
jgi:ligand-binding sensor domain-containing protein